MIISFVFIQDVRCAHAGRCAVDYQPLRSVAVRRERREGGAGAWHCFDDNAVDSWDVANLERDCFGGRFTADMWDPKLGKHVPQVTLEMWPCPVLACRARPASCDQ